MTRTRDDYWNHNTAYHPWLVEIACHHHGDVLDVGCGDGLLAQRLSAVSRSVTAIDTDENSVQRATDRLASLDNVAVVKSDFRDFESSEPKFDLVTFVASLHHMDLLPALAKARDLLTVTGEIAVVGLSANRSISDWMWAAACSPAAWIGSRLHAESRDIGVAVSEPKENLKQIRRTVDEVLPDASIRRGLYYRYLLRWSA